MTFDLLMIVCREQNELALVHLILIEMMNDSGIHCAQSHFISQNRGVSSVDGQTSAQGKQEERKEGEL